MKLNLTIDEKIQFLQGIIETSNRTMDTYVKSIYKSIIEDLNTLKEIRKSFLI